MPKSVLVSHYERQNGKVWHLDGKVWVRESGNTLVIEGTGLMLSFTLARKQGHNTAKHPSPRKAVTPNAKAANSKARVALLNKLLGARNGGKP